MKLLIISATPKKTGICDSLAAAAFDAASKVSDAEVVRLAELNIGACDMCGEGWGTCQRSHVCHNDADGFNALQEKFSRADAYVYITPVYWSEVSEALKRFLDKLRRCQATKQWDADNSSVSCHSGKPAILVASAGGGGGGLIGALTQMERAVAHMGGRVYDYIGVNRWNQEYKREALREAVKSIISEG
ncbi:MAG: flavodoxin family protein [Defluviitaleaceae bacterium]|nr:flavodoxin family protein [Defluviitaleaceae bacterium]